MRRRTLLSLTLAASVVAACSGGSETATRETTTTETAAEVTTTTEATTTTTEAAPGSRVELLEAGAEPRRELRYEVEEGQTDRVSQRNQLDLVQEIGGERQEVAVPATEVDVDYVVEEVADERFTAVGTYGETRVAAGDPSVVSEMQRLLSQVTGAELVTTSTTRGEIVDSRVDGIGASGNAVFDQLTSTLLEQASSLSFPFPEEAVGVGARWEVAADVELSGLPIEARYLVTVTGIEGDQVAADVEAALRFVPGPTELQGIQAEVIDGELTGTGTVSWDLADGLVPRLDLVTRGTATIEAAGTRLVQEQTQRSSLISRP